MSTLAPKTRQQFATTCLYGFLLILLVGCGTSDDPIKIDTDSSDKTIGDKGQRDADIEHVRQISALESNQQVDESADKDSAANTPYQIEQDTDSKPIDSDTTTSQLANIPLPTEEEPEEEYVEVQTIDIPADWKRLTEREELWIDTKKKQVIAAGFVCLTRGGLEMFICPLGTKEHESVIGVNAEASKIHACFLSLGSNPGQPVQWAPEYKKATGPKVKITVMWKEGDSIIKRDGKELIRDFETKKTLQEDWVFGGSITETDPRDGRSVYYGDGGELVCVSNFATATMDLPIESSQANSNLMFEANTEKLPPRGTKVYVVFEPEILPAKTAEKPVEPKQESNPAETADDSPPKTDETTGNGG